MAPSTKLRDLIRQIRATKTAADERAVISKECAQVRTAIREEDADNRCRNVAKLLYIHMLGYPAHFGQLECLKLCASPRFIDKRIGYLGVALLLDEKAEVALLVTNCLKNDMGNANQYVVGLALSTLGSMASAEMSRDLSAEVEKLLKSTNPYIRKKAALCAVRIIRKEPELLENFVASTRSLLSERNHAVLLTGVTLIIEMCKMSQDTLLHFRRLVPNLVRILKNLVMSGFAPDHDVNGVTDPFLQVKILRLLRILGHQDQEASEATNDILAQVATNTETTKNVGNAILYETVLAIMDMESEKDLRVLAVNILGRFLASTDKNIRYVALNTLLKTVNFDNQAVQRHRNTVVDCLSDTDISIRRRALELTFALVNETNIRGLVRELLGFLEKGDLELKSYMTTELFAVAQKFAPNRRWHIDTILKVLSTAGNYVKDDAIPQLIQIIATQETDLQAYATQKLLEALQEDVSQQALVQVATWCIGEFGDLLISGITSEDVRIEVNESEVIALLNSVIVSAHSTPVSRAFTLNAFVKLSTRFRNSSEDIKAIITQYTRNMDVELQQRSVEYRSLFDLSTIRSAILERMPVPEAKLVSNGGDSSFNINEDGSQAPAAGATGSVAPQQAAPSVLDLLGEAEPAPQTNSAQNLAGLLGFDSNPTPAAAAAPSQSYNLLDDFLSSPAPAAAAPQPASIPSLEAWNKNGLRVVFNFQRDPVDPTLLTINITHFNSTGTNFENYNFQAAVPKTHSLKMFPASSPSLNAGSTSQQVVQVVNPQLKPLRMRLRITYDVHGNAVVEQGEVSEFPAQCF